MDITYKEFVQDVELYFEANLNDKEKEFIRKWHNQLSYKEIFAIMHYCLMIGCFKPTYMDYIAKMYSEEGRKRKKISEKYLTDNKILKELEENYKKLHSNNAQIKSQIRWIGANNSQPHKKDENESVLCVLRCKNRSKPILAKYVYDSDLFYDIYSEDVLTNIIDFIELPD